MANYLDEVFGEGGLFAQRFPGYRPRPPQIALAQEIDRCLAGEGVFLGEGPCGCHVAGQEILLYNGRVKLVEDVEVGDVLMGPDGPRTVLALARGEQETVEIRPIKGEPWRVNLDHILTLVRIDNDRVVDVRVRDWFGWSKAQKALHKLFRVPVDFEFSPPRPVLPLDPYFLGVLLGDGSLGNGVAITKPDPEIVALANEQAAFHGLRVRTDDITYHLVGRGGRSRHPLVDRLRALGLYPVGAGDKFVPNIYKTSSESDRLALLAGLIDTDGSRTGVNCYDFISKSPQLSNDLAFVARSVGLAAYVKSCRKRSQTGHEGTYYRVSISGETSRIPCRIPRKKAPSRRQNKDVRRTGFDAVPTGKVEPYYGFSLDGDGRFLLGDFTVTHNTGKGLAYAVPAVWHANQGRKPIVIATANHALQEQLCEKDLPLLAELLPWKFTFALLKGRQNYLCSARLEDLGGSPPPLLPDERRELDDVLAWARATKTGDFAELSFAPRQAVKRALTVSAEDCSGKRCEHYDACFANKAKARAAACDIIVTNYHLLFTHISLAMKTGQDLILPAFDTLIMDEVHAAADIARACFGWELTEGALKRLATDAAKHGVDGTGELVAAGRDVFARIAAHARVNPKEKRIRQSGVVPLQRVRQALATIGSRARDRAGNLDEVGTLAPNAARKRAELERIQRRASEICEQLVAATSMVSKDAVSWIDLDDMGRATLSSSPVQVGGLLSRALFGRVRSAVLVSATMTTTGSFDFVRRELGVPANAEELIVPSPFDFVTQSMLVVPRDMPAPDSPAYLDAVADKVAEVIEACNGRTLVLFTSYRALDHVYARVAGGKHRVLRQGDQPKTQLVQEFRRDVHSVLLGTSSLWTGVDVPGEALSAVVIDKLPFPSPGDPVLEALKERDGKAAFRRHFLPRCIMELQQGVGRLIRSVGDKGVVVLLDRRLIEKQYGALILSSLPRMARGSIATIPSFLSEDPDAWAS